MFQGRQRPACRTLAISALRGPPASLAVSATAVGTEHAQQALENYAGIVGEPASSPTVRRAARESMVGYAKLLADFVLLP